MSLSDLLASTGGKSFKFDQVGASVTGKVASAEVLQKKNFDSGEPEFWSDGKPVEQIRVVLETSLRDPADPEDDGHRAVYIKAWGAQMRELRRAMRAAGAADIAVGGTFTATYTGDTPLPPGKKGFPAKAYAFEYVAPSATAGLLGGQPAPVAAVAPTAQAPAAPAATGPVNPQTGAGPVSPHSGVAYTAEQIAAAAAAGIALA